VIRIAEAAAGDACVAGRSASPDQSFVPAANKTQIARAKPATQSEDTHELVQFWCARNGASGSYRAEPSVYAVVRHALGFLLSFLLQRKSDTSKRYARLSP
jgi:hypothetical protein